jgi:hypothetical protein
MTLYYRSLLLTFALILTACSVVAQTPASAKLFEKDGLSFEYSTGWSLQDDSNGDAQQVNLSRTNGDVKIGVFVHRGRITPEKFPEAKKSFIDPYVAGTVKQFVQMGVTPEQSPISSEIAGIKADGVRVGANLGGETGGANIYWAIVGQRVVVLTLFGPDKEAKQMAPAWDLVRNSLKVIDPKAAPAASPKP